MKYFLLNLVILFFASCNNSTEITATSTAETAYPSIVTQKISDSLIEQLDQSTIIDSLEIMNFNIGNFNKIDAFEMRDSLFEDGWRIITKKELNFFFKKKIIKPGKYWCWDNNNAELSESEIGIIKDENDFISNMEEDSENPEEKICSLRLIRNYKKIKTDLYTNEQAEPLNHLKFAKSQNFTKIMGIEVMNKDLDILYYYDDAEKEVAKMKLRLPNYREIVMMNKYRNFIGGFSSSRDYSNYYWTTALVRGKNHHMAMDFSGGSIKDIDTRDISFAFLDVSLSDKLSVRPLK
jgi:hypothetical protein